MPPKTYSASDVARELGKSPLYIHKFLRDAGLTKTHGVYIVTEAELSRLKKLSPLKATANPTRGAA